jgi:hypothetical protein
MSKPCSPKSKYVNDPQYECGANGRYKKKAEFKTKRLPSAYNLYTKANYKVVAAQLQAASGKKPTLGEVSKALGAQWKNSAAGKASKAKKK